MTTYTGDNSNNTINGGNSADVISGGGGEDNLSGGNGNDVISGGTEDDNIDGGNANDVLSGDAGNDIILGVNGNDILNGGEDDDFLSGGNGDDSLTGGGDDDILEGGNGFDTAYYSGNISEYELFSSAGYLHVVHQGGAGADGHDQLKTVERLVFADRIIDLTGGSNNAPIAGDDHVFIDEDTGVYSSGTDSVLDNDFDIEGSALTLTNPGVYVGTYGTLTLNADGTYSYALNASTQELAEGAAVTDSFNYTVSDGSATDTGALVFHIDGNNDAPVANPDAASGHENQVLTVDVIANDDDVDDGAVLTVIAASVPAGQGSVSIVGNQVEFDPGADFDDLAVGESEAVVISYTIEDEHGATDSSVVNVTVTGTNDGPVANPDAASTSENAAVTIDVLVNDDDVDNGAVLTVTAASAPVGQGTANVVANQVEFDPGTDFDYLAVGESVVVNLGYSIEDEHGASASSTIAVTVTGTNDAPTIDAGGTTATGSVTELVDGDPDENAFTHTAGGTVAFDDVDLSDAHSASFTPDAGGYLGTFTLDPVDQLGDTVGWDFSVEDSDLDSLDEGETLVQTYTIEIDDGNGGTVTQDVTITLTGEGDNAPPDAVDDSYDAIGNVVLTVPAGTGVLANDTDDAGVGTGAGEANVTAFDASSANGGTVSMNPDGSFTYVSAPGFQGTDTFTYTLTDAESEFDVATVTITVDQPVWFIDNAAVGSMNLGTQDHPFTSIAAFNAAQGTANGPAPGETVYLREGTGTYAEPDGINLTAGQTLIGGGQDLIVGGDLVESGTGRPTITTIGVGNHGVELSTNNTLSGFDIGTTTGAGISDGAGTVGTLTVSDVGKSGGGQIVDIDQGGTLNVALNSVASTGSTGGAIDLDGVAGSFTVTGATTITGIHSGNGIDITGTSASITFAGGGLVSTGAARGVNYVGNTGSLNLTGGNFDITTTTGRALDAETGGTVTITGAGNNIVSTTGHAVLISNTLSGGVTLESVSSSGGALNGIVLVNAGSGGFTVTGLGSTAGSGGTIANKTGADGSTTQGSAIYIDNTSDVSLSNMTISGSFQNFGIRGNNVGDFTLRDSSISGTLGTNFALSESAVSFTNLTGTALFEGNVISGGRSENLRIVNSTGTLDLDIQDSASDQAVFGFTNAAGNDSVFVQTTSTASLDLLVDGVSFLGAIGDLLQTSALGSSVQDIIINNSSFTNTQPGSAGGGVTIGGGGAGSNINVDYQVIDSDFTGANVSALNALFNQQAGDVRGYISGNVVGINDGLSTAVGSLGGDGIRVGLDKAAGTGDATYTLTIVDNQIYDIEQGSGGITLTANGGNGTNNSTVEAYVHDNVVTEQGDFALSAFYAIVGGGPAGDNSQLGLDLGNNLFDNGGADFGTHAVFLDQVSTLANYYFPGYAGSPDGEGYGGTASVDLDAFLVGEGNVMINGAFPFFAGGVYAEFLDNATGAAFVNPVWFP